MEWGLYRVRLPSNPGIADDFGSPKPWFSEKPEAYRLDASSLLVVPWFVIPRFWSNGIRQGSSRPRNFEESHYGITFVCIMGNRLTCASQVQLLQSFRVIASDIQHLIVVKRLAIHLFIARLLIQ